LSRGFAGENDAREQQLGFMALQALAWPAADSCGRKAGWQASSAARSAQVRDDIVGVLLVVDVLQQAVSEIGEIRGCVPAARVFNKPGLV
jgi:hypothetical protein